MYMEVSVESSRSIERSRAWYGKWRKTGITKPDCRSESLRFFGCEGGDFLGDQIAPWSENRRAYAHQCCAFSDGIIQIFRHPHGERVEFVSILLEPIEQFPQHVELAALQGRGSREFRDGHQAPQFQAGQANNV